MSNMSEFLKVWLSFIVLGLPVPVMLSKVACCCLSVFWPTGGAVELWSSGENQRPASLEGGSNLFPSVQLFCCHSIGCSLHSFLLLLLFTLCTTHTHTVALLYMHWPFIDIPFKKFLCLEVSVASWSCCRLPTGSQQSGQANEFQMDTITKSQTLPKQGHNYVLTLTHVS